MRLFRFFDRKKQTSALSEEFQEQDVTLPLKAEIAGLQLTIRELRQLLDSQKVLLEDCEKIRKAIVEAAIEARLRAFFCSIAPSLGQLVLQQSLLASGKEVKAENVFRLVDLLISSLDEHGMKQAHQCCIPLPFDPSVMNPMRSEQAFAAGEEVFVRVPGYIYIDSYLCKSLVDNPD
jgi:hypothetical protein